MSQPTLDAARYLEHSGRECPVCHLEGVWRNLQCATFEIVNNVRLLLVPCWCTRCLNSRWEETYRLVGIEWDATNAITIAKKTYRSVNQNQQ
jgi:hypothetical protein